MKRDKTNRSRFNGLKQKAVNLSYLSCFISPSFFASAFSGSSLLFVTFVNL
jgi:hypothetical protein